MPGAKSFRRARSPGRGKSSGWALGTTLACMLALCVILFAAISAAVSHLRMVTATANAQHATNLAEAALAKAMERIHTSNYKFGSKPSDRIEITVADLPGSTGVVTFSSEFSGAYSTFNLDNDMPITGAKGRSVPARTVHLVARGRVGVSESLIECVYYKPPFPDGLAATGPVDVRALYLAGIRQGQAYSGGDPGTIPPEDSVPANLFSNATGPTAALLGPGCRITGSVGAAGGVSVDPESLVEGEVLPGSEPRAIPEIDILARMAALRPNAVVVNSSGGDLELDADWFAQAPGGLTVGGNLKLNGSVLLVTGDLRVAGALEGTGVILVDGDVEITDGGSQVTSADQVAIACTGDFDLRAHSPEGNYFQGLVYCEGDLEAKDITVVGATVVQGKNGAQGSAKLDNVRFVASPGGVSLELSRVEGHTIGVHSWAWSLTLRPDPDGEEGAYLCDARAYFTDTDICPHDDNNKNHDHDAPGACPEKDLVADWKATPLSGNESFAEWNSRTGFGEVRGHNAGEPYQGTAYSEGIPVKLGPDGAVRIINPDTGQLEPLSKELFDFFTWGGERTGDEDGDYDTESMKILERKVQRTFQDSTYQVTFNLNTLLGQSIGSSRVLVWKPFR